MRLGYSVNGYGVGDLAERVAAASDREVDDLCARYDDEYAVAAPLGPKGERRQALRDAARIELGMRRFL
jgi:L-arabinose isomerase